MIGNDGSETNTLVNAHGSKADSESGARILTQEEVDEQIKNKINPLTRQLEDLTRLIEGMSTAHRQNFSSRASTSANSSVASPSRNMVTGGT